MATESHVRHLNFDRIPLMELSTNTPYKRLKPAFEPSDEEVINAFQTEISANSGISSGSFVTPQKEPERVTLSYDCSTSSLLDDEFDESFLQEIDRICEQSARQKECQTPSTSIALTLSEDDKNSDLKAGLDSRAVESAEPNSYVKLELDEETTIAADPALINIMPDECSKYMQSLNDRQRDAACGDVSTPLMVIAGPGSGKVSI